DVGGELRVRLLADRAGVEDEHVGVVARVRLPQPELLEHALDPLRVVSVHLAAEGRDEVAAHVRDGSGLFLPFAGSAALPRCTPTLRRSSGLPRKVNTPREMRSI